MPRECIGLESPCRTWLYIAGMPQVIDPQALTELMAEEETVFGGFLPQPRLILSRRPPPGVTERPWE